MSGKTDLRNIQRLAQSNEDRTGKLTELECGKGGSNTQLSGAQKGNNRENEVQAIFQENK